MLDCAARAGSDQVKVDCLRCLCYSYWMLRETAISLYRRCRRLSVGALVVRHRARRARQNGMRPIASPP